MRPAGMSERATAFQKAGNTQVGSKIAPRAAHEMPVVQVQQQLREAISSTYLIVPPKKWTVRGGQGHESLPFPEPTMNIDE